VSEKRTHIVRDIIETIAITLLVFLIIRLAIESFRVDGQSMEPNFHNDEYVLVDKAAYLFQPPQRGDVIIFHYPLDTHKDFIKRIIGIPGDTVQTTSTSVSVDGHTISEPYIRVPFNFDSNTWKLGPNQFFVMGDNRDNSSDSRFWGFVPRENIIGKPFLIYWSYRASTEDLTGETAGSVFNHMLDLGEHFFTRTRWERTFKLVRGYPDAELPLQPLPVNAGSPNP